MPIVILPPPGNVPTGPGPVLNNQRMPTISTAGQEQALAGLGEAMAKPMMDKSQALPYEALGAVGKALERTGSVLGALQEQRIKAESEVQVAKISNELKSVWANEEIWQRDHPDTTKWNDHWAKSYQPLKNQIDSRTDLHQEAKRLAGLTMLKFEGDSTIALAEKGSSTAFAQAGSIRRLELGDAIVSGNKEKAYSLHEAMVRDGHSLPHERLKIDADLKEQEKSTKAALYDADTQSLDAALSDWDHGGPFSALDGLEQNMPGDSSKSAMYQNLDPQERYAAIKRTKAEIERLQSDMLHGDGGVLDQIIDKEKPLSEDGIRNAIQGLRLSENEAQKLIDYKKKYIENQLNAKPFDIKEALSIYDDIQDYNPEDDKSLEKWSELAKRVTLIGGEDNSSSRLTRGTLNQQLYLKHPFGVEKEFNKTLPKGTYKILTERLNEFVDNKNLGDPIISEPATKATDKGVVVDPDVFVKRRNPSIFIKRMQLEMSISNQIISELKKNPSMANDPRAIDDFIVSKLAPMKAGALYDSEKSDNSKVGIPNTEPTTEPGAALFGP